MNTDLKMPMETMAITDAVKAEVARVGLSGKEIARRIGRDRNYIYERYRYEKPFDTNDLALIAKAIGITTDDLFRSAELGKTMHSHELTA